MKYMQRGNSSHYGSNRSEPGQRHAPWTGVDTPMRAESHKHGLIKFPSLSSTRPFPESCWLLNQRHRAAISSVLDIRCAARDVYEIGKGGFTILVGSVR